MNIVNKARRFFDRKRYTKSYSQCGEDVIVSYALATFGIDKPYYIDIGAHDPYLFSNTAFFYEKGACGVCIEPDPSLFKKIEKVRTRDVCLPFGVNAHRECPLGEVQKSPFYLMSASTLNTFSKAEAQRIHDTTDYSIVSIVDVEICSINSVMEKFSARRPNFISLDVEGLDESILHSFDFSKYSPEVFCVETLEFVQGRPPIKYTHINDFMASKGYEVYADTYINTIYRKI